MQMGGEKSEPIAIVGSSCRLPGGVTSPSKLWELLENPRDVLRDVSAPTRFDTRSFYHENGDHHGVSEAQRHSKMLFLNQHPKDFAMDTRSAQRLDRLMRPACSPAMWCRPTSVMRTTRPSIMTSSTSTHARRRQWILKIDCFSWSSMWQSWRPATRCEAYEARRRVSSWARLPSTTETPKT